MEAQILENETSRLAISATLDVYLMNGGVTVLKTKEASKSEERFFSDSTYSLREDSS